MKRLYLLVLMMMMSLLMMVSLVAATDITVVDMKCYPDQDSDREAYERGQTLTTDIELTANKDVQDVEIKASFSGYDGTKIQASTEVFDLEKGTTYVKKFTLTLPDNMEPGKYHLRFNIDGKSDLTKTCYVPYRIVAPRNLVKIKDNSVSPTTTILPGEFLQIKSLVKNIGQKSQSYMKFTLDVPELGITSSSFQTDIGSEESVKYQGIIKIPGDAKANNYFAKLKVTYYEGYSQVVDTIPFTVKEKPKAQEEVIIQTIPGLFKNTLTKSTTDHSYFSLKYVLPGVLVVLVLLALLLGLMVLFKK